jgi:Cu+-exporting ATPase
MHPEVSQPEPGRCPKCGMPLEPRKKPAQPGSSAKPEGAQHDGHEHHGERR